MGRACLLSGDLAEAGSFLEQAVTGLRKVATQHHMPRGLLARAEFYRLKIDFDRAQRDLDEAFLIAGRGPMRLHQTDCHLEQARLSLDTGDVQRASDSVASARELIQQTGYHRRDAELAELEAQISTRPLKTP
jgi:hypothetical protein